MEQRFEEAGDTRISGATLAGVGAVLVGVALGLLMKLTRRRKGPGDGEPGPALECFVTPTVIRLEADGRVRAVNSTRPGEYRPTEVHLPRNPSDLRRFGIKWFVNNTRSSRGRWVHIRNVDSLFEPGQPLGAYINAGSVEWFASCFRRDVPAGRHKYDIWVDNRQRLDPEIVIIRDLI